MKTKTIVFRNDFHKTTTVARAKQVQWTNAMGPSDRETWAVSSRVMERVERDLCGVESCTRGGLRGGQSDPLAREMWEAYRRWAIGLGKIGECDRAIVYAPGTWKGSTRDE